MEGYCLFVQLFAHQGLKTSFVDSPQDVISKGVQNSAG